MNLNENINNNIGKTPKEVMDAEFGHWKHMPHSSRNSAEGHLKSAIFPFKQIDYHNTEILDYGSGAESVFEYLAPDYAYIYPYDILADRFNKLVRNKKFQIISEVPDKKFDLVTCLNMLDHVGDPSEIINKIIYHLKDHGEVWIYVHIDRPYDPDLHPQKFRIWSLLFLLNRYLAIKKGYLIRKGRLFPYAYYGIHNLKKNSFKNFINKCFWLIYLTIIYCKYHSIRAVVKMIKLCGLRNILPKELQF